MIKHLGAFRPFFLQNSHYTIAFFPGGRRDIGTGFAIAVAAICVILLVGLINDNKGGK